MSFGLRVLRVLRDMCIPVSCEAEALPNTKRRPRRLVIGNA